MKESHSKDGNNDNDQRFHGKGKYTFDNGVIYEGDFSKGEFHGEGVLIYQNGVIIKCKYRVDTEDDGPRES